MSQVGLQIHLSFGAPRHYNAKSARSLLECDNDTLCERWAHRQLWCWRVHWVFDWGTCVKFNYTPWVEAEIVGLRFWNWCSSTQGIHPFFRPQKNHHIGTDFKKKFLWFCNTFKEYLFNQIICNSQEMWDPHFDCEKSAKTPGIVGDQMLSRCGVFGFQRLRRKRWL